MTDPQGGPPPKDVPAPKDSEGRFRLVTGVLGREYRSFRRQIVIATALTSMAAIAELVIVFLIAGLGAAVLGGRTSFNLIAHIDLTNRSAAVATMVAIVLRGAIDLVATRYKFGYMEKYEREARATLMKAFLDAEWEVQAEDDSGNVQTITAVYLRSSASALATMQDTLTNFISTTVLMLGGLAKGGPWLLAILAGSALIAIALRPLIGWAHRAGQGLRDSMRDFSRLSLEMFGMAREIRLFRATDHVGERIDEGSAAVASANRQNMVAAGVLSSLQASLVYVAGAIGLLAIVFLKVHDPVTWVTVVLLVYRGLGQAKQFQFNYQSLVNTAPSIIDMQQNRAKWQAAVIPKTGIEYEPPLQRIEFDQVGFNYTPDEVALHPSSFTIQRGEALGLMGPSGSGKSTIVQLLLRLRVPTTGQIRVNGIDMTDLRPQSWYGRAVMVPQEASLFGATVLDNVRSFRDTITRDDVIDALRQAHVLDEIMALPQGLETYLGETGRALSGGQRQRVCIARALAAKPDVLVLDEPTSALDMISEEGIRQTLEALRGDVTLVIIAHRPSTLKVCDSLMVMEGGRITAHAPRAELEANSEFFTEAMRLAKMA